MLSRRFGVYMVFWACFSSVFLLRRLLSTSMQREWSGFYSIRLLSSKHKSESGVEHDQDILTMYHAAITTKTM